MKMCVVFPGIFRCKWRVPSWRGGWEEFDLSQELPPSKVAEDSESTQWIHNLPMRPAPPPLAVLRRLRTTFSPSSAPSDPSLAARVAFWASLASDHYLVVRLMWEREREREREREKEREAQWRRGEKGAGGGRIAFTGAPLSVIMVDMGEGSIVAKGNEKERRERGSLSLVWLGHCAQSHNFYFYFLHKGEFLTLPRFFEGKPPLCPWQKTRFYKYR